MALSGLLPCVNFEAAHEKPRGAYLAAHHGGREGVWGDWGWGGMGEEARALPQPAASPKQGHAGETLAHSLPEGGLPPRLTCSHLQKRKGAPNAALTRRALHPAVSPENDASRLSFFPPPKVSSKPFLEALNGNKGDYQIILFHLKVTWGKWK